MIDVEIFRIRYVVDIIKELFQVKEVFMEHLNNFNIISGIKIFTSLLKIKDILLPVHQLKDVKCAVTIIICMAHDI